MDKKFLLLALTVSVCMPSALVYAAEQAAPAKPSEQVQADVQKAVEIFNEGVKDPAPTQPLSDEYLETVTTRTTITTTETQDVVQPAASQTTVTETVVTEPAPRNWGYASANGPNFWADMDPAFAVCNTGQKQSPVNIAQFQKAELPALDVAYQPSQMTVINSGHAIALNYDPGSVLKIGAQNYELTSLGFRTPSEHYVDGAPYPMEMQLVHRAEDGAIAIVSVMVEVGAQNAAVDSVWQNAPLTNGANVAQGVNISALDLLPLDRSYFTYEGSLTTPPCTENVQWYILRNPVQVSESQLVAYQKLFPLNARFLQPLNAREVLGN